MEVAQAVGGWQEPKKATQTLHLYDLPHAVIYIYVDTQLGGMFLLV